MFSSKMVWKALSTLALTFSLGLGGSSVLAEGSTELVNTAVKHVELKADKRYFDVETGQTITNIYKVTEGGYQEITFEEFKKIRAESKKISDEAANLARQAEHARSLESTNNSVSSAAATDIISLYTETNRSPNWLGSPEPISNPQHCDKDLLSCPLSVSYSRTKTETFTAGIDLTLKSKIKAAVGGSWSTSASITSTYSFIMKPGQTAQAMFAPYYTFTSGTGKTTVISGTVSQVIFDGYVQGMSPNKLSTGELSGLVYANVSGGV